MNIFVTDNDPDVCAKNLDDKRVNKMILESAQLMSTTMHRAGSPGPYRITHQNHPCTLWTGESRENYMWLFEHFNALIAQFELRFGHGHSCSRLNKELLAGSLLLTKNSLTPFRNCTIFKEENDVLLAYKKALLKKWSEDKKLPKWTNTTKPLWEGISYETK